MKVVLLVFLISVKILPLSNPSEMMKKGNEYFLSGDYQKSIEVYEKLIADGFKGASLYFNLGNAYYRVGKIGLSILYYEKAKQFSPNDEDINHNLNFVRLQTKDKIEKLPAFFLFDWWEVLLSYLHINQLTVFSYLFFLISLIAITFYVLSNDLKVKRISFYSIFVSVTILIISVSFLILKLHREENLKYGVLITSSTFVKSSPDPESKDVFIIHEGLKFKIEDKIENWYKIRLDDGKVGWIDKYQAGII